MITINVKEARQNLKSILDRVERGEEVAITRRGKQIAHIIPHVERKKAQALPSLKEFRKSLASSGTSLSDVVKSERDESRF